MGLFLYDVYEEFEKAINPRLAKKDEPELTVLKTGASDHPSDWMFLGSSHPNDNR